MGVAIVMNKGTTCWKEAKLEEIVKGRAIMVNLPWCAEKELRCLAVYTPNKDKENQSFWKELREIWERKRLRKPTCMMGDFNVVEDSANHLPP